MFRDTESNEPSLEELNRRLESLCNDEPFTHTASSSAPPPPATMASGSSANYAEETRFQTCSASEDEDTLNHAVPPYSTLTEEAHGVLHWEVSNWPWLPAVVESKQALRAAGRVFRISLYPDGNREPGYVSLYLTCQPATTADAYGDKCIYFCLAMSNAKTPSVCLRKAFQFRFTPSKVRFGVRRFASISTLRATENDNGQPILQDGCVRISAYIRVIKDPTDSLWKNTPDTNLQPLAGYAGLKRNTKYPYLSSLIHSLYHMQMVQSAICSIPTHDHRFGVSVAGSLQQILLWLETSTQPLSTNVLASTFPDNHIPAHPVSKFGDFYRRFIDRLAIAAVGTPLEGTFDRLFGGRMIVSTYYHDISLTLTNTVAFQDLTFVAGDTCRSLHDYFIDFCAPKPLNGEDAAQFEKGETFQAFTSTSFDTLPPALNIHIQNRDAAHGIEFPAAIDLSEFVSGSSSSADPYKYTLYGAFFCGPDDMATSGYSCYLSPDASGQWVRFSDSSALVVSGTELFGFSGQVDPVPICRETACAQQPDPSARVYMLIYIRDDMRIFLLEDEDIWEFNSRIETEAAFASNRNLEEACQTLNGNDTASSLATGPLTGSVTRGMSTPNSSARESTNSDSRAELVKVRVIDIGHFREYKGFDIFDFEAETRPGNKSFFEMAFPAQFTLEEFKMLYAYRTGIDAKHIKFWTISRRENGTLRCSRLLDSVPDPTLKGIMRDYMSEMGALRLYCDVSSGWHRLRSKLRPRAKDTRLVFLKYYDVAKGSMVGVGHMHLAIGKTFISVFPTLRRLAGVSSGVPLVLYEEVEPGVAAKLQDNWTLRLSGISTGGIICYQIKQEGHDDSIPEFFEVAVSSPLPA